MKAKQQGFSILTFIVITVMLAAVLSATLLGGTDSTRSINNNLVAQQVAAQASLIRTRILQCAIEYPQGNNGSYRAKYPSAPTIIAISALTCPGSGTNLWSALFPAPAQIDGLGLWQYTNDITSMRLSITTNTADRAALTSAIVKLLGPQASEAITSPTESTVTWVIM